MRKRSLKAFFILICDCCLKPSVHPVDGADEVVLRQEVIDSQGGMELQRRLFSC